MKNDVIVGSATPHLSLPGPQSEPKQFPGRFGISCTILTGDRFAHNDRVKGERDGYVIDKRYVTKQGNTVLGCLFVSAVRAEKGCLQYNAVACEDITEQQAAHEQYKLLAEYSTGIIYRFNVKGERYIYMSPAVERISGYTDQEALALQPTGS